MIQAPAQSFYISGGTLPVDAGSYVVRKADTELFEALRNAEFCYILNTRQMGKSSLMVRTANRLRREGVAVVGLDITAVGQNLTPTQWYDGLLALLAEQLHLETPLEDFWQDNTHLGPMQRFLAALQQVVLPHVPGPIVIFVDEIDAVRSLPFSADEFFAGIRECHNRRALDPEFGRLTFCLLGVATPTDLIANVQLSPFNIGRRIPLHDFTLEEAALLAEGMQNGTAVLRRVLYWTGGNPYMTQRLCRAVVEFASAGPRVSESSVVDRLCAELFLTKSAHVSDDNLAFARNRLLQSEGDVVGILELYQQIWNGRRVPDDDANPLVSVLKLSGVVRNENGSLVIRNRIYRAMFDRDWVRGHMPDAELRRQRAAYRKGLLRAATVATVVVLALGILTFVALRNAHLARSAMEDAQRSAALADQQRRVAEHQKYLAEQADLRATRLAEERRIALENVLAERNRTQQERKRADKAAIAVAIERSHAIAEKRRADMEAKRAQAMARAFAAQQPEVTATGPETVPDATAREYGLERNKGELFSPFWLFKLKPADADMVTRAGVTCVTIHAIDESDWHVEAVYRLGELEEGPVYRLQFQARADTSRDMEINIQIAGGTYRSIVSPRPKAHLSTTWRTYQYVVRPRGVGEQNQIAFFLGNKVGKVWLKNVSLKKETK